MATYNIPDYIIKITTSYLTNRTNETPFRGKVSQKLETIEGLPQGSMLSPTLFNIFINDIPGHPNTKLALFADDTDEDQLV